MTGSKKESAQDMAWAQWNKRISHAGNLLSHICGEHWKGDMMLTEIRVKPDHKQLGSTMIVVKGTVAGKRKVAFHIAADPTEALVGAIERFDKNDLRWKDDQPYKP